MSSLVIEGSGLVPKYLSYMKVWMIQALLGVEGLHEKQVVHQDLHLGNFLIVSLDDELRLVVADLDASLDWTKEEQTALSEYKLFEAARIADVKSMCLLFSQMMRGVDKLERGQLMKLDYEEFTLLRTVSVPLY
ncbi:hypothetical protein AAVH_27478 [Aphelenchoides avenae]|nr:hypothetical protein AAVH_27478 [Aphelenchus avenae]